MNNLIYEELKLGEKAKEAYKSGKSTDYIKENCAVYLNTKPAFLNLNVTDLVISGVLAGMNALLVGDTGTGKSQLAADIANYYFNGDKHKNKDGQALILEGHPEFDLISDLTYLDMEKGERKLNGNHEALFWNLEELNRCPAITQNQFYAVGNGRIIQKGFSIPIGRKGYVSSIATANLGNGEFQGTFETDKALYNRLPITIDFDYEMFKPTREDQMIRDMIRAADPNIKKVPLRDISDKIIEAKKEIEEITLNPSLEAITAVNYIRFGLDNCQKNATKGKVWPLDCQDCDYNKKSDSLCSLIKSPTPRTQNSMIKYAAALYYLSKLKNPEQEIDPVDLIFKSFEITGAYQSLLNPQILRQDYKEQNPKMMADVVKKLTLDYNINKYFILSSLEATIKGRRVVNFAEVKNSLVDYDSLVKDLQEKYTKISPYNDKREIGMEWMEDFIKFNLKK